MYVESIDADSYETNNTFSSASEISRTGTYISANISSATDKDYYKIALSEGETLTLNLTNLQRDYEMRLYNPSQSSVRTSTESGTDDEDITYTATSTGYYYVYIYGYSGACCSSNYRLNYSISVPMDEYEEHTNYAGVTVYNNNTHSNRTLLYFTNSITINPTISFKNDEDWFQFTAPKGQVIITLDDLPYDYDLYLYSDATTQLASSTFGSTNNEKITCIFSQRRIRKNTSLILPDILLLCRISTETQ